MIGQGDEGITHNVVGLVDDKKGDTREGLVSFTLGWGGHEGGIHYYCLLSGDVRYTLIYFVFSCPFFF